MTLYSQPQDQFARRKNFFSRTLYSMRQGGKWSWLIFLPGELILNVLCLLFDFKAKRQNSTLVQRDDLI